MADEEENPLFAIDFSSSDNESSNETPARAKVPRDFQSEADFQRTRAEYRVKVEDGDLHQHLPPLPIDQPSKQMSQAILHAIEELYFYRRYQEALELSERVLKGELDTDFRRVVEGYRRRCLVKLGSK